MRLTIAGSEELDTQGLGMHTILEDVRGQAERLRWSCIQDVIVKREVVI